MTAASEHFVAPWCVEADIPLGRLKQSDGNTVDDVNLGWMIAAATDLLYVLSGRQWRTGRSIVRPCSIQSGYNQQSYLYPYSSMSGYGSAWGFAAGWAWTAIGMGWWQNGRDLSIVTLQGPIQKINDILVDGASLGSWSKGGSPNPNYTVYNGRDIVRNVQTPGGQNVGAWPYNQQLQLPVTMPGTWQIDYEWGSPPPEVGRLACAELAVQLALSFSGSDDCKLPSRVLSIATQGVSVAVGDALTFLLEDLTGLPICDSFLRAYNPNRRRRRAVFLAPNSIQAEEVS